MITVQIDDELEATLNKLAKQEHKPVEEIVNNAVREAIEDYLDTQAADAIMDQIESGVEQLADWKDVKDSLYDVDD